ncbi:hypothetical protein IJI69_00385 [Candidatus Saccharibacteria bacterium]|nr:hypothetical protein [Candidatus Saccharibacteria bacterium]MBQ6127146.1 hypothetical protein [Candidatus Saccharibacteria bacterium]
MAYTFAKVPQNAFNELQVEAGVLLTDFDPTDPELVDANILCATTGGINASCVPTFSDWAEDVDNAPNNMKEFKRIDGWDCTFTFTALSITTDMIKLGLGAADIDGAKVTPRRQLNAETDFSDLWWVGDTTDDGFVAVKLINALSTGGFSIQSGKNAKGQFPITLTGHVSIEAQDVVPMEFYVGTTTE